MAIDVTTKKFLEEVKKGKPRRFAMICKGVKILNLIVYKKGSEEKHKKELKKADGSGQFFGGVVTGKGRNITFELPAEDYERPPGKSLILKQFLEDEVGMSFKVEYAIVDQLSKVDESDVPKEEESAESDSEAGPDKSKPSNDSQPASTNRPPTTKDSTKSEQHSIKSEQPVSPETSTRAAKANSEATKTAAKPQASEAEKKTRIAELLMESLDEQRPLVDQLIEQDPSVEDDLIDKMSDIVDQIRTEQFKEARENISALGHIVNHLLTK